MNCQIIKKIFNKNRIVNKCQATPGFMHPSNSNTSGRTGPPGAAPDASDPMEQPTD